MFWNLVTDFGDSAAMLPAAGLLGVWLLADHRLRDALVWAGLFAAQSLLVAATKIAFRGWGIGVAAIDFTGISGHATLACSVLPIALATLAHRQAPAVRWAAWAAGCAAGLLVGVSRVILIQHSWSEAAAGCALGAAVAAAFLSLCGSGRSAAGSGGPARPIGLIGGALAATLLLMHGAHAPSDRLLTKIALHLSGRTRPYVREWQRPWSLSLAHDSAARSGTAPGQAASAMLHPPIDGGHAG